MRKKSHSIAVVGVGNELFKDEGFGIYVSKQLAHTPPMGVAVVEGGTSSISLLPLFFEYENLIFLDIIKVNDEPGSIFVFDLNSVKIKSDIVNSFHDIGVSEVYNTAKMLGSKASVYVVGIVPYDYHNVGCVTELLLKKVPLFINEVQKLVAKIMQEI